MLTAEPNDVQFPLFGRNGRSLSLFSPTFVDLMGGVLFLSKGLGCGWTA